jgi:hypothetical protein
LIPLKRITIDAKAKLCALLEIMAANESAPVSTIGRKPSNSFEPPGFENARSTEPAIDFLMYSIEDEILRSEETV